MWSMTNYYHYIESQIFSSNKDDENLNAPQTANDESLLQKRTSPFHKGLHWNRFGAFGSFSNSQNDDQNIDNNNNNNPFSFRDKIAINARDAIAKEQSFGNQQNNINIQNNNNNNNYTIAPLRLSPLSSPSDAEIISSFWDKSVVFIGMAHNVDSTLSHILSQLNEVQCIFNNTFYIFFESNSDDLTSSILLDWSQNTSTEYCSSLYNDPDYIYYPSSIHKQMIFGDDIIRKELNREIFARSNTTYIHKLSRIEKFVPYRNMLLRELYNMSNTTGVPDIDYIFMIDLDVYEIDFKSFLYELVYCSTDIMCINGVDMFNDYRDSFASVEMSHNWIYRPFIFNKSDSYYEKARNILRKKMPRKNQRFEQMRSCFNGLTSYKISANNLKNTNCKYYLNDDILLQKSKLKDRESDDNNNEHNDNSNRNGIWINQITKLINWSSLKGIMYDKDSGYETNLCEHISFHYCLYSIGDYTISIAKDTKLYYYPLAPPQTKEDRRAKRRRRRRNRRDRKDIFMQHNN